MKIKKKTISTKINYMFVFKNITKVCVQEIFALPILEHFRFSLKTIVNNGKCQ